MSYKIDNNSGGINSWDDLPSRSPERPKKGKTEQYIEKLGGIGKAADTDTANQAQQVGDGNISPRKLPTKTLSLSPPTTDDDWKTLALKREHYKDVVGKYNAESAKDQVKAENSMSEYEETADEDAKQRASLYAQRGITNNARRIDYSQSSKKANTVLKEKKKSFKEQEIINRERNSVPFAGKTISQGTIEREAAIERESQAAIEKQAAILNKGKGKNSFWISDRFSTQ